MTVSQELENHILDKIFYHKELMETLIAEEDYFPCAYHRDEIKRLSLMIEPEKV